MYMYVCMYVWTKLNYTYNNMAKMSKEACVCVCLHFVFEYSLLPLSLLPFLKCIQVDFNDSPRLVVSNNNCNIQLAFRLPLRKL